MVCSHDGILHSATWNEQLKAFSASHRVACWDRRGYGRSEEPTTAYSSVDDLACVVRAVSEAPAVLIGCSYGALLSLHCALDHPELVAALVLVGPIVSGLALSEHFSTRGGRRSGAVASELEYWAEVDPWLIAPGNAVAGRRIRELLTANPQNLSPKAKLQQRPQPPALPRLRQIAVPTLIVVGELDIPDVHAHSGAIEAATPRARRIVLAGCGHPPPARDARCIQRRRARIPRKHSSAMTVLDADVEVTHPQLVVSLPSPLLTMQERAIDATLTHDEQEYVEPTGLAASCIYPPSLALPLLD